MGTTMKPGGYDHNMPAEHLSLHSLFDVATFASNVPKAQTENRKLQFSSNSLEIPYFQIILL